MSRYVIRDSANAVVQTFYQTVTTASGPSVTTECRLVINDLSALAITLGSSLDVEIDGATTFKWRKNGGAWTTLVPITTTGVSIDGGNATVYFLASSGFNATDTWSWYRYDRSYSNSSYINGDASIHNAVFYKGVAYFTSMDFRIMSMQYETADNDLYAISVGYRPVYGTYLVTFDDHLVVGRFSLSAGTYYSGTRNFSIGWSDKGDLHNFISTDVNEADSTTLAFNLYDDGIGYGSSNFSLLGLAVLKQNLFVFTSHGMFLTSALGLPLVFSYQYNEFPELLYSTGVNVVHTTNGVYLFADRDCFWFDGATLERVSLAIEGYVTAALSSGLAVYDSGRQELVIYCSTDKILLCYQEKYKTWYSRNAGFLYAPTAIGISQNNEILLGASSRTLYTDNVYSDGTAVYDSAVGTAFGTPKITTQAFSKMLAEPLEVSSLYFGGAVESRSSTYYSIDANVQVQLHWYTTASGLISGSPSTNAASVWVTTNADGMISFPRLGARAVAFEIQVVGLTAGKPPYRLRVTSLEPMFRVTADDVER